MWAKLPAILKSLGCFKQLGAILIVCSTFILRPTFVCKAHSGKLWPRPATTRLHVGLMMQKTTGTSLSAVDEEIYFMEIDGALINDMRYPSCSGSQPS